MSGKAAAGGAEDAAAPKRPASAYLFFLSECRANWKAQHPGAKLHQRTLCAAAGQEWARMGAEERARFVELSNRSKADWAAYMQRSERPSGQRRRRRGQQAQAAPAAVAAVRAAEEERSEGGDEASKGEEHQHDSGSDTESDCPSSAGDGHCPDPARGRSLPSSGAPSNRWLNLPTGGLTIPIPRRPPAVTVAAGMRPGFGQLPNSSAHPLPQPSSLVSPEQAAAALASAGLWPLAPAGRGAAAAAVQALEGMQQSLQIQVLQALLQQAAASGPQLLPPQPINSLALTSMPLQSCPGFSWPAGHLLPPVPQPPLLLPSSHAVHCWQPLQDAPAQLQPGQMLRPPAQLPPVRMLQAKLQPAEMPGAPVQQGQAQQQQQAAPSTVPGPGGWGQLPRLVSLPAEDEDSWIRDGLAEVDELLASLHNDLAATPAASTAVQGPG